MTYLQYGCGLSAGEGWVNFDSSPTLRLQKLPVVGGIATRSLKLVRFPSAVRFGDIRDGLLAPENSCAGIYASHVLEHLSFEDFRTALRHTFTMLRPGGLFRMIVPDLEVRARLYLERLSAGSVTANNFFMEGSHLGSRTRGRDIVSRVRDQLGNSKHLWMWDERSLRSELEMARFVSIRRCDHNDSADPAFRAVEDKGRFFDTGLGCRELAMECMKPGNA